MHKDLIGQVHADDRAIHLYQSKYGLMGGKIREMHPRILSTMQAACNDHEKHADISCSAEQGHMPCVRQAATVAKGTSMRSSFADSRYAGRQYRTNG